MIKIKVLDNVLKAKIRCVLNVSRSITKTVLIHVLIEGLIRQNIVKQIICYMIRMLEILSNTNFKRAPGI